MLKREGWFSISFVLLLLISGMTALINIPDDMLPFNLVRSVNASFAGGNGSADNPYQISNVIQLQDMRSNLTAHYVLINDINASETINWNNGSGFDPVGDSYNKFSGSLEGQNYYITNLFINRSSSSYVGLFGSLTVGATITYVSLIENYVSGDHDVGGLVGWNEYGTVSNCSATVNVSGVGFVGGLVGENYGTVSNCYATVNVSGDHDVGGLVGKNSESVSNCYATVNVSGSRYIGGLVGFNSDGTVSNCSATGNVSGTEDLIGGLVGFNNYGTVSNSYYCINITMVNNKKYITPYGIYEHQYNAWINNNKSLDIDDYLLINSSKNYYNISNINDMKNILPFAASGNFKFKQTADIDLLSETGFYIPVLGAGIFNGNGYSISNLNVTFYNNYKMGMFGYIGNGVYLRNITLIDNNVSGVDYVGGLVGLNYGTVSNCSATGNVSGYRYIGGLVGENYYGTVSNCYSTGNVSGDWYIGGLVGYNNQVTVENCYSTGNVSGYRYIGGLVGINIYSTVSNCYSKGKVSGHIDVGGLAGENYEGTVSYSFWDTQTSGQSGSDGGTGRTTKEMKEEQTFTDAGWDFATTWSIVEDVSYPFLLKQYTNPVILSNIYNATEDEAYSRQMRSKIYWLPGCENSAAYSLTTDCRWLSISPSGLLSGMPLNEDVGTWWANVMVMDLSGNTDTRNFTLNVVNINDAPLILTTSLTEAVEDQPYWVIINGEDMDPTVDVLKWKIVQTDAGFLNIDPSTGNLTGLPNNDDVGTWWGNVSVSDGNGGTDCKNFTLTVININDGPALNVTELTLTMEEDSGVKSLDLSDVFIDIDGDLLSFDHTGSENLSISIQNGIATIIPDDEWCGFEIIQFTASDGSLSVSINVTIEVTAINDAPLDVQIFAEPSYFEGGYQIVNSNATDVDIPFGDELTFTWKSDISGEIGTGRSINLSLPVGFHLITLTVTDNDGLSATATMDIEIKAADIEGPDDGPSTVIIIIGILTALIILALLIFLIMKKNGSQESNEEKIEGPIEEPPTEKPINGLAIPEEPVRDVIETQQEPQLDVPQKMHLQEVPGEPVVADNAVAPIQEAPLEQPLTPNEGNPDQVVPDPDMVPLLETPVEEQMSDEIPLESSEQTTMVEDLLTDNGPY